MRARFSRSIGLPVLEEDTGEICGALSGILIHPDTGIIEGFFVRVSAGLFSQEDVFLQSIDIFHWGARITVRHGDVLAPVGDLLRLQPLLTDPRPVLGQHIITVGGRSLGRCADVQFSTKDFRLEWLFPRRFLRWGIPIPASAILEVRPDAIVIRDAAVPGKEEAPVSIVPTMPEAA